MTRVYQIILSVVLLAILSAGQAQAQGPSFPYDVDSRPSRGIMPNSEQLSGPLDNIDPTSGKLHIQIPLASLPSGHAGSGFDLALTYDSHLFDLDYVGATLYFGPDAYNEIYSFITPALAGGGWLYNFKNYSLTEERRSIQPWETSCDGTPQYTLEHERTRRYRITLPDGSQHILHLLGHDDEIPGYWGDGFYAVDMAGVRTGCAAQHPSRYPSNINGTLTFYTTDGSYLRLQINADGSDWRNKQWTLFYADGRRVLGRNDGAEHLYDANNNGIHISSQTENGHTVSYIADDLGRQIRIEHSYTSSSSEKEDKITTNGPQGLLEWRVKWQLIQIGGPGAQYVCAEDYSFNPPRIPCGLNKQYWVVKYIQLPLAAPSFTPSADNTWTYFEFTYPSGISYGRLASMRVPGGAVYSYAGQEYSQSNYARDIANGGYTSRTVMHDGVSEQWTYSYSLLLTGLATVTNPDGGQAIYHSYDPQAASQFWSRGLVYWIEEPNGTVRKRQWTRNRPSSLAAAINVDPNNPYVERESVTVDSVVGQPRTTVTDYLIDKNGNSLQKKEYDWSATLAGSTMETPGALLRATATSYHVSVPASTDNSNGSNRYWSPSAPLRLNAAARATISDETSAVRAVTEFTYDDALTRGNVTYERRWDDETLGCTNATPLPAACPVQHREYSATGNLIDIYEPAIRTHIEYVGGPYPTLVQYGTTSLRSFTYSWNATIGTLNSKTDNQNAVTTTYGYDAYGRPSWVNENNLRITRTSYDDEHRSVLVKHDLGAFDDGLLQSISHADQLGRVDLVRTSDGSPLSPTGTDGIKVTTAYETFNGGSRVVSSSPHRTLGEAGMLWSCTQRDQSGRVVTSAQFKGASTPTDCTSDVNRTGATTKEYHMATGAPRTRTKDAVDNKIDHYSDALGRLTTVVEDPTGNAFYTTYQYGVFDNLKASVQAAGSATQQRTFTYSSLGRLKTANNPETGEIAFTYADNGDLRTRKDARNFLTTLEYDDLHRVSSKTYSGDSDVTPDVTYTYHSTAPCIGQLQSVVSSVGSTSNTSCDALGRITGSTQYITGSGTYSFVYTYWLSDSLKTMKYPSGELVVNYDVDNAGRALKVYAGSQTFADMTSTSTPPYRADGRLTKLKFGNGLWETRDYQVPGTPTVLSLGTTEGTADKLELKYNYSADHDNGNLLSHVIRQGATAWSQTYEYDPLNRLICATETTGTTPPASCTPQNSWRQAYGIDRFGNRWVSSSTGFSGTDNHEFTAETWIDKSTNRLNIPDTPGPHYDGAGNLLKYSPWTLTYDAENRLLNLDSTANGNSTFTYDGAGRRIKSSTTIPTSRTTLYIYDAGGRLAAEYSTAPSPSGTSYLFSDLLGTPRAITAADKSIQECSDYSPFGRLLQTSNRNLPCHQPPSHTSQQFTGQVRDQATNLDYFGARYFSGGMGRFISPDMPMIDQSPTDPQSWNLYTYVRNNPLKFVDPSGRDCIYSGNFDSKGSVSVQRGNCTRKDGSFVDGTVDTSSLTYDARKKTLGYRYSTSEGGLGTGVVGMAPRPGDELDAKGLAFVIAMSNNVDKSNRSLGTLMVASAAVGTMAGAGPAAATAAANAATSVIAQGVGWYYGLTGAAGGVVLGKFADNPSYIRTGSAIGANVYNIPEKLFDVLFKAGQAWTANKAFIDASIWRGQQFFTSSPGQAATGMYAQELEYLASRGIVAVQIYLSGQ